MGEEDVENQFIRPSRHSFDHAAHTFRFTHHARKNREKASASDHQQEQPRLFRVTVNRADS